MSTILKALRRLEEQKARPSERPLRDEVVLAPSRASRRGSALRAAVAGVVLALAGAALIFALRDEPAPEGPEIALAPEPPAVASPPPAAAPSPDADASPPTDPARITVASSGRVAPNTVVPVPEPAPDFEIVRPNASAPAQPLAPRPLPTIAEEEILAESYAPGAPRIAPSPPPDEYVDAPLEAAPEPRVATRTASPIRVARTLWHPSAERRLAWVEVEGQTALREVREGERIGPYVVREIEPAAVLFAEGGVELRREVGP